MRLMDTHVLVLNSLVDNAGGPWKLVQQRIKNIIRRNAINVMGKVVFTVTGQDMTGTG